MTGFGEQLMISDFAAVEQVPEMRKRYTEAAVKGWFISLANKLPSISLLLLVAAQNRSYTLRSLGPGEGIVLSCLHGPPEVIIGLSRRKFLP